MYTPYKVGSLEGLEEWAVRTIPIPYYTGTLDLHVAEENLKAVVTAKMHHYKAEKGEEELVREAVSRELCNTKFTDRQVDIGACAW